MLIILVSVVLEVGLFSFREAFVHALTEYMHLGLIGAHSIFAAACFVVVIPALSYNRSALLAWYKRTPSAPDISETQKIQTQPSTGRAYSIRTAQEIFESIIDCTSMQSDDIVRPYIGKWLKVNSTVQDVIELRNELSILVNVEMKEGSRTIFLRFNKKQWKARLETAKIGDRLIAEGKMKEIETFTMQLVDCEIIKIKPKGDRAL